MQTTPSNRMKTPGSYSSTISKNMNFATERIENSHE